MIRVYLDMDGVLADFDKRAKEILGVLPREFEGKEGEQELWNKLFATPDFFYSLDPMPDCFELVEGVQRLGFHPTILTGVPKRPSAPGSAPTDEQKREWVRKHLGPQYRVITCLSKYKCLHMEGKGDVLIDDSHKWRHNWIDAGGVFILHTDAEDSLKKLEAYRAKLKNILFG